MRPAVFLDRDGTLNAAEVRDGRPHPPARAQDVVLLDGVAGACAQLRAAGLVLVCITNQPDIARGTTTAGEVEAINARVASLLELDALEVCPHDDADGCDCRKPAPGLITGAASRLGLDLSRSVTVGDRWRDVAAGRNAGTRTVFIDRGYDERRPEAPDLTVTGLEQSVSWILEKTR